MKKLNNISVRSESVKDILTAVPSKLIRWGSALFLILIILVFSLSWIIKYPDIISAEAYLTTPIPPQKIYAKTTARIDTILVSNKQHVEKNTILAILENTSNSQDVLFLKSITDTIAINQEKIFFPFEKLPILFLGELESHFSIFENSYFEYVMNNEFKPYSNKLEVNKFASIELANRLNNLVNQQKINNKELIFIKKDVARQEILLKKGIISQQTFENKQLAYFTALRAYENNGLLVSELKQSLNSSKSDAKSLGYNKNREEIRSLKEVIHNYNQLKKAVRNWELNYILKSNCKGNVSFLEFWNTNQTVVKDDLVFMVSTDDNPYYLAKLKTPKSNSGKIKIGQLVNVMLNDYPEYEFGVLRGHVKHISNVSDSHGTYIVDVILPKELKTSHNKHIKFKQEMQGTAAIITEDLRLLERLLYQFKSLFSR
ncbi:HlyD family secretion protein [Mariniflexile sp.]|uniref:HlyD family secretion protein n=1 Tax=Mariniflexile sp. TaxID=1979402 RepID=UPI0040489850